jgi:hypothetical protein
MSDQTQAPAVTAEEQELPLPAESTAMASPEVDLPTKRPRPVLGPALTLSATLLWAFVVIGTFTTSWLSGGAPLTEGAAIVLVTLVTVGTWARAVRQSRSVPVQGLGGLVRRSAAVGLLAFGMWALLVVLATVAGKASASNIDPFVSAGLLAAASAAVLAGRRLTAPARPARTRAGRVVVVAFWIGVAAVTLGACVEIVAES